MREAKNVRQVKENNASIYGTSIAAAWLWNSGRPLTKNRHTEPNAARICLWRQASFVLRRPTSKSLRHFNWRTDRWTERKSNYFRLTVFYSLSTFWKNSDSTDPSASHIYNLNACVFIFRCRKMPLFEIEKGVTDNEYRKIVVIRDSAGREIPTEPVLGRRNLRPYVGNNGLTIAWAGIERGFTSKREAYVVLLVSNHDNFFGAH